MKVSIDLTSLARRPKFLKLQIKLPPKISVIMHGRGVFTMSPDHALLNAPQNGRGLALSGVADQDRKTGNKEELVGQDRTYH